MKRAPYLFSTLGMSLMTSLKATDVPIFKNSKGYSNFWMSNENGSILFLYSAETTHNDMKRIVKDLIIDDMIKFIKND